MRIVICEDEVVIAEHLKSILLSFGYSVEGIAHNYKDSIRLIDSVRPDLALLDIRLEGHSDGVEVARHIARHYNFPFIFLTASTDKNTADYALSMNPFGYIVKPFNTMEVYSTIQIAMQKHNSTKDASHIIIKAQDKNVKLFESQILWIKSDNIYIDIVTPQRTYTIRKSLKCFSDELQENFFMKCHRSYIVNINHIDQMQKDHLLIHGTAVPISRQFRKEIRDAFKGKHTK